MIRLHPALRALSALSLILAPGLHAQGPVDRPAAVEALLRRMTLEEKVGEMTQLTIAAVAKVRGTATVAMQLDSAKLEDAIVRQNVGSLLNVWDAALTPAQWRDLTTTVQRFAGRRRLPIPVIYGIDAVHGDHYMRGSTVFPQNLAMAATWNPLLMRLTSRVTAYETRASGVAWNFAPVLDLGRQPLWSRFPETFGEDVHLASVMGAAATTGNQEDPTPAAVALLAGTPLDDDELLRARVVPDPARPLYVAASAKHFLGYSMPLSGRDRTTAWIPDRQLREYFLPPFRAAIDAGIATVMVNSGDVNGIPVHASRELLTDLLRTELGFRGVVVSDWEDIVRLQTVHRAAATRRDAVRMALDAGVDMSMVPYNTSFIDDVLSLVRAGEIPVSRIDASVRRILRLKLDLGLFDDAGPHAQELANVGAAPFLAVSRRAAEEAITLLKNDRGVLPLARTARVLVTGPGATSLPSMYGGWSYTWQGTDTAMYPASVRTLLDAVRERVGAERATFVSGTASTIPDAVAAARAADVVLLALAEPASAEKPGDIADLTLPDDQMRLARAIVATGKPVILALFEGRPRIVRDIVDSARAVVLGYQTGPYGGEAMAAVLFGEVNPSGRLPFTYPRSVNDIEHYDRLASANVAADGSDKGYTPQWDFGAGLSYTTFTYDDLRLDHAERRASDTVQVSVAVTNTGRRTGREVVQLYVRDLYASVDPPMRRLRDFEKILLTPGERRVVTFRLPVSRLGFVGRDLVTRVEPGEFEIQVGGRTARLLVR
ncbi:MAG TPA: glycoside hydrolase family 3 N-terminal domain-containing protein [Gemmatimonadaceae bacterium]|nr:glycoside hydrolase family 3 N-terminal domain-containing protein [Gemmatimonadaceae bacterium]